MIRQIFFSTVTKLKKEKGETLNHKVILIKPVILHKIAVDPKSDKASHGHEFEPYGVKPIKNGHRQTRIPHVKLLHHSITAFQIGRCHWIPILYNSH